MKIIWSARAAASFSATIDYISRDNPATARKWAERVFKKIEGLELVSELKEVVA